MNRDIRMMAWALALSLVSAPAWAAKVTQVEFMGSSRPNQVVIKGDGPLTFDKQENSQDKQIIINLPGASLANKSVGRPLDASSFNSNVKLISPYNVKGEKTVRIVVQLKEMAAGEVTAEGNTLKLTLSAPGEAARATPPPAASAPDTSGAESVSTNGSSADDVPPPPPPGAEEGVIPSPPAATAEAPSVPSAPQESVSGGKSSVSKVVESDSADPGPLSPQEQKLENFIESRKQRKFIGSPVTLQVKDADVTDVFRLIGDASGFNIILGDDVRGKITLALSDVPWDLALDTVLHTLRLGAERSHNVLRIVTLTNLTAEKQEELRAKKAAEATAPRVTRVFPISFAKLEDLQGILTKFGGSNATLAANAGGAGGAAPGEQGIVQIDQRTNSIIVRDIPENIERMRKLIELLDTQTPQVVIEGKIIEATEGFNRSITGSLGLFRDTSRAGSPANQQLFSANGANPTDLLVSSLGSPGIFTDGNAAGNSTVKGGGFGLHQVDLIPGSGLKLNALLTLAETESQIKVVSSPKTVVVDKQKAKILQSTPVLVPTTSVIPGIGPVVTQQVQQANLSLDVTPTVTNEGSILMDINFTRDVPADLGAGSGVANRNITTTVLVDSGNTLVIGGVYTKTSTKTESGIPYLRDIPILGALFGTKVGTTQRSELFIFITPRILNEKEAGLSST